MNYTDAALEACVKLTDQYITDLSLIHILNKLSDTIKKKVESGEFPNIKYTCILRDGIPDEEILRLSLIHIYWP